MEENYNCKYIQKYAIKRNEKGNLCGRTQCIICKKEFEFEENKNSDAVAIECEYIPENRINRLFVRLNVTSKCPNCGYKTTHFQIEENETLK